MAAICRLREYFKVLSGFRLDFGEILDIMGKRKTEREEEGMSITIGQVLKQLRMECRPRLTQARVEELSGGQINRSWLANLETDVIQRPPARKLEVLARLYGVTMADVYERAGLIQIPAEGLAPEEKQMIETYRSLTLRDRGLARRLLRDLAEAEAVAEEEETEERAESRAEDEAATAQTA